MHSHLFVSKNFRELSSSAVETKFSGISIVSVNSTSIVSGSMDEGFSGILSIFFLRRLNDEEKSRIVEVAEIF